MVVYTADLRAPFALQSGPVGHPIRMGGTAHFQTEALARRAEAMLAITCPVCFAACPPDGVPDTFRTYRDVVAHVHDDHGGKLMCGVCLRCAALDGFVCMCGRGGA